MSTHNIYFKVKYEKVPKLSLNICHFDMLGISLGLNREFKTAIVFQPLLFDSNWFCRDAANNGTYIAHCYIS